MMLKNVKGSLVCLWCLGEKLLGVVGGLRESGG